MYFAITTTPSAGTRVPLIFGGQYAPPASSGKYGRPGRQLRARAARRSVRFLARGTGGRSLDTSDKGSQSPPQAQLTRPDGHPTLEEQMRAKAATGELLDGGGGPFDLAAMQLWGKERAVTAAVLRDLLVEGHWPVHTKGVRLRGVKISGLLDLEGATLRCPLFLDSCYLDADDPACLDHATASRVAL